MPPGVRYLFGGVVRQRTGIVIGAVVISHNPENTENPFELELGDPDPMFTKTANLDYEDFENLIKWFRWQKKTIAKKP